MKYLLFFALLIASTGAEAQTRKDLIGCWNMPGLTAEYLSLDSEGNFFFNDYQEYRRAFDPVIGTWKLSGGELVLSYDEQKQIRFRIKWMEGNTWVLVKPGKVRLYKARIEDCDQ